MRQKSDLFGSFLLSCFSILSETSPESRKYKRANKMSKKKEDLKMTHAHEDTSYLQDMGSHEFLDSKNAHRILWSAGYHGNIAIHGKFQRKYRNPARASSSIQR